MNDEPLIVEEVKPAVTCLTLNRPDKRNALNIALLENLCNALDRLRNDSAQRVVILRGAGSAFCTGLDLKEAANTDLAHESAGLVARALRSIHNLPRLTIAAVHGPTVAGGAGLMSACDLAVAAEDTRIGYPETRRGLVAGLVLTFLCRQTGLRNATELLTLGKSIDAPRAQALGLVNRVVPLSSLMDEALTMADTALKAAPGAVAHTKRLMQAMAARSVDDDLDLALEHHMQARTSDEAKEGIAAFFEKRSPRWDITGGEQ